MSSLFQSQDWHSSWPWRHNQTDVMNPSHLFHLISHKSLVWLPRLAPRLHMIHPISAPLQTPSPCPRVLFPLLASSDPCTRLKVQALKSDCLCLCPAFLLINYMTLGKLLNSQCLGFLMYRMRQQEQYSRGGTASYHPTAFPSFSFTSQPWSF